MNYGISLSAGTGKNIEFIKDAQISNVKLVWLPERSIFKDKHFFPQPSQGPRIRVASHDVMSRRQEGFFSPSMAKDVKIKTQIQKENVQDLDTRKYPSKYLRPKFRYFIRLFQVYFMFCKIEG